MKCPVDQSTLLMTDRQGIEIDYCQECRGVWLDRGELDKMIERNGAQSSSNHDNQRPTHTERQYDSRDDNSYGNSGYGRNKDGNHHKRKKESFIGDLFDF
jgi:uncharacterized protein